VSGQETGFSLIEILVTMIIAAGVVTVTGTLLSLVAQQTVRSNRASSDVREAMAFMRLVDRLLSDVGAGADALVIDRDTLTIAGFGAPRSLAAAAEVVARLAREPSGGDTSHVVFTIARFDGDVASATSRRTETVLADLERFEIAAEIGRRWVTESRGLTGPITRLRFAWLRKGGRPRIHEVEVRFGVPTACIRNPVANGCSMLVP
jgi:prepilin-type N-terminal cleavage/methylation domain-containing protein